MSILTWNIDGLKSKEKDTDFIDLLLLYDVVNLLETWCECDNDCDGMLHGYVSYGKRGTKLSKYGRRSGGIKVYIREKLAKHFTIIDYQFEHAITYKVDKDLCGHPMIYVVTYLPPEGSKAYKNEERNGVILLEEYLKNIKFIFPNYEMLVTGDLNARTQDKADYIVNECAEYLPCNDWYVCDSFDTPRNSKDLHCDLNLYGKSLIQLCCTLDIHIANGRFPSDKNGEFTCFANGGKSIVDYTLMSTQLFPFVNDFKILERDEFTHLPQVLSIQSNVALDKENTENKCISNSCLKRKKLRWNARSEEKFDSDKIQDEISEFSEKLDNNDVSGAADIITNMFSYACVEKSASSERTVTKNAPWWDNDCELSKKHKYKCLRLYRLEHSDRAFIEYCSARKSFKGVIKKKKFEYKVRMKEKIEKCASASDFWKIINSFRETKSGINSISSNEWNEHFRVLLNTENEMDNNFKMFIEEFMENHDETCNECVDGENLEVDRDFTVNEVEYIVNNLVSNKSPGIIIIIIIIIFI